MARALVMAEMGNGSAEPHRVMSTGIATTPVSRVKVAAKQNTQLTQVSNSVKSRYENGGEY